MRYGTRSNWPRRDRSPSQAFSSSSPLRQTNPWWCSRARASPRAIRTRLSVLSGTSTSSPPMPRASTGVCARWDSWSSGARPTTTVSTISSRSRCPSCLSWSRCTVARNGSAGQIRRAPRGSSNAAAPRRSGTTASSSRTLPTTRCVVAAHSWATLPLRRLLDLLDISLLTAGAGHATVFELAREWELERVWRCMIGVADALLGTASAPFALRTWGRNLRTARDLNVVEAHVRRLASPFWALPASRAIPAAIQALGREFVPGPEDDWRTKATRIAAAVRRPLTAKSAHDRALEDERRSRGELRP